MKWHHYRLDAVEGFSHDLRADIAVYSNGKCGMTVWEVGKSGKHEIIFYLDLPGLESAIGVMKGFGHSGARWLEVKRGDDGDELVEV